jgi:membrane-associated phospholipid phosphatase
VGPSPEASTLTRRGLRWGAGAAGAGFVALAIWVSTESGPLPGERRVLVELHDLGTSHEDALVRLADLTDLLPLALAAVAFAVVLAGLRRWRDLAYASAIVGVVWAVNPLLKELVARSRPDLWPAPMELSEYTFPSGHGANTAALAAAVLLVAWTTRYRAVAAIIGGLVVAVVGLGQLVLGVHYPSDIVAGWLWAAALAAFVWSFRVDD